jgi:hypothetical protein
VKGFDLPDLLRDAPTWMDALSPLAGHNLFVEVEIHASSKKMMVQNSQDNMRIAKRNLRNKLRILKAICLASN